VKSDRIDVAREHVVERRAGRRDPVALRRQPALFLVEIGEEHAAHLRVRVEQRDKVLRKLPCSHDSDFDAHRRNLSPARPSVFNANPAD
jgi:hypothetical protein